MVLAAATPVAAARTVANRIEGMRFMRKLR
ncbi:Uncharacterised protein [Bordetella pertussis]|nr:Uncharacterised protein [Bordetella pertussis]CFW40968.1 Uncharacterised protein [Bordetella pertussis]